MFKFTLLNYNLKHFLFIVPVSQCHCNHYTDRYHVGFGPP